MSDDRIKTLKSKVTALEHEAAKIEQYSGRPNRRFTGIPETEGTTNENIGRHQRWRVLTHRYVHSKSREALDLERKLTGMENTSQRAIIVRFGCENNRDAVYRGRFMLKKQSKPKVFVNEDLTLTHAVLAFQTRRSNET